MQPSFEIKYLLLIFIMQVWFPFPKESFMVNILNPRQMEIKLLSNLSGDYKAFCDVFPFYRPA